MPNYKKYPNPGDGKATIMCDWTRIEPFLDPEIKPLVKLLYDHGFKTVGSCSGHGESEPVISLAADNAKWVKIKSKINSKKHIYDYETHLSLNSTKKRLNKILRKNTGIPYYRIVEEEHIYNYLDNPKIVRRLGVYFASTEVLEKFNQGIHQINEVKEFWQRNKHKLD